MIELRNIIKEIIQKEIVPELRGASETNKSGTGIWHSDKGPLYFEKDEKFPYLWHIKSKESASGTPSTQIQTKSQTKTAPEPISATPQASITKTPPITSKITATKAETLKTAPKQ